MTRLLASVRSPAEARIALAGGADVIDLKEPRAGTLGAVSLDVAEAVVRLAAGKAAVSATVGDLPMHPSTLADAVSEMAATGVSFVKVGLFGAGPFGACLEAVARAGAATSVVAVLFADQHPAPTPISAVAAAGFRGIMLDTADKRAGGLRAHLTDGALARFVMAAQEVGLVAGLAGSLAIADIAPLLALGPDYLGFRGALCAGGAREATLDAGSLADVRRRIPQVVTALA